ncbi:MAG: Ig-like domain-containing protein, partial [Acidobacteria bacterium]|nr:Ig-like domain-containing protein [Candidatus Polarisedimenticola svalbardensis]
MQFTCADYATPPHLGVSNSFVVEPGAYSGMQVLLPGQNPQGGTASGFTGNPDVQAAGSGFSIRIRAVDQYFNRVPGIGSHVAITSTDENLGFAPDPVVVNGELLIPVTVYRAGRQTISAADDDISGIDPFTSSEFEVTSGPYTDLLILAPGESLSPGAESGRSGTATDQSINYAFTVTVYATDQWFNPVAGVTDLLRITSGDPMAQLPADAPMIDGTADFAVRLSTGGFQQITAVNVTQPTMAVSTTEVKMISSGFHLEAEINPSTVQAGSPFSLTVKVTNDAGSVIQEINSSVTVEVRNASTQNPGQGTLANTNFQLLQGQHTETETYTFAEDIVLVITDDAGNIPALTGVLTVLPGAPSAILLTSNPPWLKGNNTALLTARVEDAFQNGVPGLPVAFTLLTNKGQLTPLAEQTDDSGAATAEFLSPREPNVDTVRAVSGALSIELDIETALVDPNAPGGTLTNYPNPFHPDETPTTIAYVLEDNASVRMRIYTLSGGLVLNKQFTAGDMGARAGLNEVPWDGRNGVGEPVASGGYILFIEAEGNGATMHIMRRK